MSPAERSSAPVLSTGGMIQLEAGRKVYVGGRLYVGKIPARLCPEKFRPASKPEKQKVKDAESAGAGGE